ncbi:MAG: dihydrofolate reductase [Candidatus Taylorbacteria bacterium]|nr:dihydrofolate reductase [Candidatus Taylorbacteria bacterium]
MKVFIIAALSADGFIAKSAKHFADWPSKEDKKRFVALTKRAGVMVMGRKTFETIGKALPGRRNIVYTRRKLEVKDIEPTRKSPAQLIRHLKSEGVGELAVCGGSQIYTLFMKAGVVDTLYLTLEPIVFGEGVRLFAEAIDATLELVECRKENQSILLEYKVIKNGHSHQR